MTSLLNWYEAYEAGPSVCGGKGYNLARLARYGFGVPHGGVLPAGAWISAIGPDLEQLGLENTRVAVRSSATAEDSSRASFAGIHRSYLNVRGRADVERAAQGCIDSLTTPEAQSYRRRMGFADEEVRCAVVICEMVDALCAGVAFSCDPANGRRDLILIDAAEGLGDRLAQGAVNPVRMSWRRTTAGLVRESGPTPGTLLPSDREQELVHIVERVQWALGEGRNPQDVEWAYDGERIWILQARPVTVLPRAGWSATASLACYWSTANLKDNLPGVPSELSWSSLCNGISEALYSAQRAAKYEIPPGMELIRRFHGRAYFDLTGMQWAFYDAFGILPADTVQAIGGSQPQIPVPKNPLGGQEGRRRRLARLRLVRQLWAFRGKGRAALKSALAYQRQLREVDRSQASRDDLRCRFEQIEELQRRRLELAGLANSSPGPWRLALDALLPDADLIARLQTGAGGVASAETGYRLCDVAQGKASIEEFIEEFGHHTAHEGEFLNPRWAEDRSWILRTVGNPARESAESRSQRKRRGKPPVRGSGIETAIRLAGTAIALAGATIPRSDGGPGGSEIGIDLYDAAGAAHRARDWAAPCGGGQTRCARAGHALRVQRCDLLAARILGRRRSAGTGHGSDRAARIMAPRDRAGPYYRRAGRPNNCALGADVVCCWERYVERFGSVARQRRGRSQDSSPSRRVRAPAIW